MNSQFYRLANITISLLLLNGCGSNPAAYQRVQKRQDGIRARRVKQRTEKFIAESSKFQDQVNDDIKKNLISSKIHSLKRMKKKSLS